MDRWIPVATGSPRVSLRTIRRDDKGLLGMPFRLLIALVTLALIVPAVVGGWSSVDFIQTDQRIRAEITRVLSAAQSYLQAGSGGESLHVSLHGGMFTRVEYVVFGDLPDQAYSRAVRYKLSGGERETIVARNPSVRLSSLDGGDVALLEGSYTLRVECFDGRTISIWPV